MRGKNKIQVNLVLPWRRNAMEGKSPAPQPTLSYSSVCALRRSSEELVCSHKGIMWNYSTILFSEYLFQPFSRRNLLRIKAGIERNEQKWREEAVRRVGPRERGDSSKTTWQSVYCEYIDGLLRPREIFERLVLSEFFARIKSYVNGVCFDSRIGAKSNEEQTIQNLNAKIESLELELEKLKCTRSF